MPSLQSMLNDTMLFVAARGAGVELIPAANPPGFPTRPPASTTEVDDDAAADLPVWHWKTSGPSEATDVTCLARGMGNGRMTVCDKIGFSEVFVKPTGEGAQPVPVPLSDDFVVKTFQLEKGHIKPFATAAGPGTHFLYPLEAKVDKSYLYVLVIDFPDGFNGSPKPLKNLAALDSDIFMPGPDGLPPSVDVIGGERITITVTVPRIVVFISLICCKERNNFEPGGILGGGRMVPHMMIMSNRELAEVRAAVSIKRPTNLKMEGGDHSIHQQIMNNKIENAFYADDNTSLAFDFPGEGIPDLVSPLWSDLFDCYLLGVDSNTVQFNGRVVNTDPFVVVRPDFPARSVAGAVERISRLSLSRPRTYAAHTMKRVARQGAFDNLHVAPTMKSDAQPTFSPPQPTPADVTRLYGLDRVFMAPFCEHDCLHTHWRWGTTISHLPQFGWSEPEFFPGSIVPGKPHKVAGAPMVPVNQEVRIGITGPSSFIYRVTAKGLPVAGKSVIPSGTYTFINHHGSGYSIKVDAVLLGFAKGATQFVVATQGEPVLDFADALSGNSAHLYWHMRFGGVAGRADMFNVQFDTIQERVRHLDMTALLTR